MKNEFILAFNEVIEEKQLPKEIILQALESAMAHAYRRSVNASTAQYIEAKVDPETGKVVIHAEKEIVEVVQDNRTEVTLEEAKRYNPDAEIGGMVVVESTPADFGRVAAQTARQVIQQRIRDAERSAQLAYYSKQLGEIINGIIQAASAQGLTIGLELRAEGILARKEMIPGERYRIRDRVRALVAEVTDSPRGPQIILSRTHRDFLRRLLENEVPEIYHGIVEIRSIAREPGERAKVAVSATQTGIDPVGACVGIRGVRIQAIVRELHNEKIDVIEWNSDPVAFIAKAISPARVSGVYLSEKTTKTATVVVPEDQLSLAIGRDGQNARLAAKLTGWRIDIKSLSEAATEALNRLQTDEGLAEIAAAEVHTMEQIVEILAKKAESRPLNPEEYDILAQFIDRVEKRVAIHFEPVKSIEPDVLAIELGDLMPLEILEKNLLDSELPDHVTNILQESGYQTVGDLVLQMKKEPDEIFRLQGIGPRAMDAINKLLENVLPVVQEEQKLPVEELGVIEQKTETVEEVPQAEPVVVEPEAKAVVEIEPVEVVAGEIEKIDPQAEAVSAEILPAPEPVEVVPLIVEPEKEVSFEELFTLKPSAITTGEYEEEDEGEILDAATGRKKKKKKKRKFTEIEYDPEADRTVVRKIHKRGDDWTEEI